MTDRPMAADDMALETALRALAREIDWPVAAPVTADSGTAGPDIAMKVRARLVAGERGRAPRRWWSIGGRPVRRSLVLAIAALLALAIVAAAVGLGLPGLRITFGEPPATVLPSPSATPTGSQTPTPTPTLPPIAGMRLNLGRQVALDEVEAVTGVPVKLPTDERFGPPDSVWVDRAKGDQVAYVWKASADLPETLERGVGLVLMRFDGADEREYYEKMLNTGTSIAPVQVAGHDGYWISGDPHFFFYTTSDGAFVEDSRRWVGDALIWNDGTATYRIESALGRAETIEIAETIE
jgi:hypothetical protein